MLGKFFERPQTSTSELMKSRMEYWIVEMPIIGRKMMRDPIQNPNSMDETSHEHGHGHCTKMKKKNCLQAQDSLWYIRWDVKVTLSVKRPWQHIQSEQTRLSMLDITCTHQQQTDNNQVSRTSMLGANATSKKRNTHENHECCMYKSQRPVDTKGEHKRERIR